MSVGVFV